MDGNGELNGIATVADLRRLIDGLADPTPVRVHFGWDLAIVESGFDDADGAVLLFPDSDAGVSTVSTAWLNEVSRGRSIDGERARRQVEFLEILADGGGITVNGIPWREMFERLNAIVSDPLPNVDPDDDPQAHSEPSDNG